MRNLKLFGLRLKILNQKVCCAYRHPSSSSERFTEPVETVLNNLAGENNNIFILVDFNINLIYRFSQAYKRSSRITSTWAAFGMGVLLVSSIDKNRTVVTTIVGWTLCIATPWLVSRLFVIVAFTSSLSGAVIGLISKRGITDQSVCGRTGPCTTYESSRRVIRQTYQCYTPLLQDPD